MSKPHNATFCPECGWNVKIDEDGTCAHCGATAIGPAVDEVRETIKRLNARVALADSAIAVLKADKGIPDTPTSLHRALWAWQATKEKERADAADQVIARLVVYALSLGATEAKLKELTK